MDTVSSITNAPTVAPGDSASQVNVAVVPPTASGGKPKRPSKSSVAKDAPPGAVQVPPGKTAPGGGSKVTSATIPLSGWGNLDLYPHRRDIEPTFTVDARPFADMVDTTYQSIQARYSQGGKHIPRSLYRYYCYNMWWYRALWLHKSNGNVLNTDQKNFLSVVSQMEDLQLPTHVAQYLANMGNFQQGGEQYYFRMIKHNLVDCPGGTVKKGWLETSTAANTVDDPTFWRYAQLPVPGVMATAICNEADLTTGGPADNNLDVVAPVIPGGTAYPTENIIGWNTTVLPPAHSSWRATFGQLGWSLTQVPGDVQTSYLVSTSTMKWVSERLSTMKDFKVNSIKQLSLSSQGHPMLAYYLGTETAATQKSQFPRPADYATNTMCASRYSELAVKSRFAIDTKVLAPAFAFGYRLDRSLTFRDYHHGLPRYYQRSNYQPWLLVGERDQLLDLTIPQLAGMNETILFGSQGFLNVSRFSTHELHRSVGLDAALVLSDAK